MFKNKEFFIIFSLTILLIFSVTACFFENGSNDDSDGIPITIWDSEHEGRLSLDESQIIDIVRESMNTRSVSIREFKVSVLFNEQKAPDYLIVYGLHSETYSVTTTRIDLSTTTRSDLSSEYSVSAITDNYILNEDIDFSQDRKPAATGQCPDSSIQMVFSTCETGVGLTDNIPSAKKGVTSAAAAATKAGYKVKTLLGAAETTKAMKNWLSCPNLILWGRIGHGMPEGIVLYDKLFNAKDFQSMPAAATLEKKVLYINSCEVHNKPIEPAILGRKVQKYIGGDTELGIGTSEPVFVCWVGKVVKKGGIAASQASCYKSLSKPATGKYGISGTGADTLTTGSSQ